MPLVQLALVGVSAEPSQDHPARELHDRVLVDLAQVADEIIEPGPDAFDPWLVGREHPDGGEQVAQVVACGVHRQRLERLVRDRCAASHHLSKQGRAVAGRTSKPVDRRLRTR